MKKVIKSWKFLLLPALMLLAGEKSLSQTTGDYCIPSVGCYTTFEKAEAALRARPEYAGIGQYLEHVETTSLPPNLVFIYDIKNRPAVSVSTPGFRADLGLSGSGIYGCQPPPDDSNLDPATYCASETSLISAVEAELTRKWNSETVTCTITSTTPTNSFETTIGVTGSSTTETGMVYYQLKIFNTKANCTPGPNKDFNWRIVQNKMIYCDPGFRPQSVSVPTEDSLLTELLCKPYNTQSTSFRGPIKQCKSCAGSKNPIFPATGEKIRAEQDFTFAGRVFTRHYRSSRQVRNNPHFGIGWTHTFSDRLDRVGKMVFSEAGDVEAYDAVSSNRFRGQNSYDNMLEYINTDNSYRLTLPGGEIKEFDADGRLFRIRNLQDPSLDVTLAYANGVLISATDAQGRVLKFFYKKNLLSAIQLPDGKLIDYKYDLKQNLTLVEYGGGEKRKYHYAESGLIGDPEQVHKLTGISNVVGPVETRYANFKYDAQGRAISSTVFGTPNEVASVTYDSANQATVTRESGAVTTYTMGAGTYRPITDITTSGVSGNLSRLYDSLKRVTRETDRRGIVTTFTYPTEYNRTITSAVGTPEQRRREVDRNTSNLVTQVRVFDNANVLQSKTTWTYNTRGQILTETFTNVLDNSTRTNTKTYCESADVTSGTCPLEGLLASENRFGSGDTTSYTYRQNDEESCATTPTTCLYRKGDLWKITNALGHISEIVSYDGAGRVLATKDFSGVMTEFEYDFKGRQTAIEVKGDGDRVTSMTYTSTNQVKQINNPDGTYIKYDYDDADRLTSMEDNLGNKMIYTLNADGKTLKEEIKDSGGIPRKTLAFTYNNLSQMTTMKDAQSQLGGNPTVAMTYDSEGNLDTTTDALSRQSRNEYDSLGRVKKIIHDAAGLLPQEVNQKYSALDKVTKITDPKNLDTNYLYNGFGDSSKLESKDTGNTYHKYDTMGQLVESKDANGKAVQYGYDILGRIRIKNYDESPTPGLDVTYTYDELPLDCERGEGYVIGKLTKIEDGSGSTAFCYNAYGDLVRKVQIINGKTFVLRWVYKANGQLDQMIYPDGLVVDYTYNSLGQVSEVGVTSGFARAVLLEDATYYPFGPIAGWDYGNGRSLTRNFDLNYRPSLIRDTSSGGINYTYLFNGVGNLTQLQAPGLIRDYKYDGLNRLKSTENSSQIKLWEYNYDVTGNRTSVIEAVPNGGGFNYLTKNYAYDTNSHRLTFDGTEYSAYDLAGNLTKTSATALGPAILSLSYNSANRLHSVTKSSGSVEYVYNSSGERVQRTLSTGGETYFVYQGSNLLGEYSSSGAPIKQMIWLQGMPVGLVTGTTSSAKLYYVQADALGTPRTVIDPVRNLSVWKNPLENEAFGKVQPITDPDLDGTHFEFNLRFPGQIHDGFTGLVYNYFRDYDPKTGRYVQSDPIGLAGGISTYSYVESNPLKSVDPMGLLKGPGGPPRVGNPVPGAAVHAGYISDLAKINPPLTPLAAEQLNRLTNGLDAPPPPPLKRWTPLKIDQVYGLYWEECFAQNDDDADPCAWILEQIQVSIHGLKRYYQKLLPYVNRDHVPGNIIYSSYMFDVTKQHLIDFIKKANQMGCKVPYDKLEPVFWQNPLPWGPMTGGKPPTLTIGP
ncbi:MAG: RHS repeat-associated core domain-containing protein [Bdellovibrionota bacterium]